MLRDEQHKSVDMILCRRGTYLLSPKLHTMPPCGIARVVETVDRLSAASALCYQLVCEGVIELSTLHALFVV